MHDYHFGQADDFWYQMKHRIKHPHWQGFHLGWNMFFTWKQTHFNEMFYWLTQRMETMQYHRKHVIALFLIDSFETICQWVNSGFGLRASCFITDSKHLKTDESTRSTVSRFHLFLDVWNTLFLTYCIKHILALTCSFQKSRLNDAQQSWSFSFSKCLLMEQSVLE